MVSMLKINSGRGYDQFFPLIHKGSTNNPLFLYQLVVSIPSAIYPSLVSYITKTASVEAVCMRNMSLINV